MSGSRRQEPTSTMDAQHRGLFEQLHRIVEAQQRGGPELAGALAEYRRQVLVHFADEERLLETRGYPELEPHRAEHAGYLGELERLSEPGPASIAFLRGWLVNHTTGSDRRYIEWLAQRAANDPRPSRPAQARAGR